MTVLVTSCGRHDLLEETLTSLFKNQSAEIKGVLINEDSETYPPINRIASLAGKPIYLTSAGVKAGQHASIEWLMSNCTQNKYVLFLEDDWLFDNSYDWIRASIDIMEADPKIIKVLARKDSPHPMKPNCGVYTDAIICQVMNIDPVDSDLITRFGYLKPWENNGINWCGFSWNPGVTRLDLLKQFMPFGKHEQDVAQSIYDAGYKVVALEQGVYTHIGEGRSTHE